MMGSGGTVAQVIAWRGGFLETKTENVPIEVPDSRAALEPQSVEILRESAHQGVSPRNHTTHHNPHHRRLQWRESHGHQ